MQRPEQRAGERLPRKYVQSRRWRAPDDAHEHDQIGAEQQQDHDVRGLLPELKMQHAAVELVGGIGEDRVGERVLAEHASRRRRP